jgi:hypothetical protein
MQHITSDNRPYVALRSSRSSSHFYTGNPTPVLGIRSFPSDKKPSGNNIMLPRLRSHYVPFGPWTFMWTSGVPW